MSTPHDHHQDRPEKARRDDIQRRASNLGQRNIQRLRGCAAKQIDWLMDLLDSTEPNANLENGADTEPGPGSVEQHPNGWRAGSSQENWAAGNREDREGDGCADDREGDELQLGAESLREDDEDNGDGEPSLGSTNDYLGHGTFYQSARASAADLEGPHDDLEPSLCGVTVELRGNDQDLDEDAGAERECDPAENGIADFDGLMEQHPQMFERCDRRVIA